ncbi:MAG: ATP-binding cassette domain-containing protein [Weeksellaceae bacterium]|nr:ATP-binding cassette domain-containing protein [Weeksellaceae bacterium]
MSFQIDNVSKRYGEQWALKEVSFSVEDGEVIGLLGPNGAGKSTLMKCIVSTITPNSGHVYVQGKNVQQHPMETKRMIGYLSENNPLYLDMYVQEYLSLVADFRKCSRQDVEEVIEKTGLTAERNKIIRALSKGYKQRVGLAQAIIHKPQLLILDEPTNGLDPNQIIEIRQLIKEVGHGKTVLLSTHIMQEVEALCTRVILLNKGQLIKDQNIENFKGKHQSLEEAFHTFTTS